MLYNVEKIDTAFNYNGDWNSGQWDQTDILKLTNYMGDKPDHFPNVQVKTLYDNENLYVSFQVKDQYVRSIASAHQGHICLDSCVEFFFTPGEDISLGFFNIEVNCGGYMLLHHQKPGGKERQIIGLNDIDTMVIRHSMPQIVEPEITKPVIWTLKYKVPFAMLEKYAPLEKPEPGVKWKANFYKCADKTSHPHWLTWSVVEYAVPNFHLPEFFGTLQF